jgi:hypothetical protein
VQTDCLEHALAAREPHGIWGGHNEFERKRLQRRRAVSSERAAEDAAEQRSA